MSYLGNRQRSLIWNNTFGRRSDTTYRIWDIRSCAVLPSPMTPHFVVARFVGASLSILGDCAIQDIHSKLNLTSNIAKSHSSTRSASVVQSVANTAHYCALCKISNRLADWVMIYGQTRFHEIWIYDAFWTDILYCTAAPLHLCRLAADTDVAFI